MNEPEFTRPATVADTDKQEALSNQGYHYPGISSDRRFEELVYSIYKNKIAHDPIWKIKYDNIALMERVGDKGIDCALYKNGLITGAVQCKKYNDRISKTDCISEILKFVLYSFLHPSILPAKECFDYYFVTAAGFSGRAAEYLDKFSEEIIKDKDLEQFFNKLKHQYKAFHPLEFKTVFQDLLTKLSILKIHKIIPQELDLELSQSYAKEIIPLFFQVRSVIDNSEIESVRKLIQKNLSANQTISLSDDDILLKCAAASLQLSGYQNYLTNYKDSHIDREETKLIISWINAPLKDEEKPVLLLTGDPGFGKTVILKDVLNVLTDKKIPVIAIKSDRYYAKSITELQQKLNLDFSFTALIDKLKQNHQTVVVLIDQVDSLSQSVTSRRDYIDTYNKLLHELKELQGVRIVLSIRSFDLNNDYEFSSYQKFHKVVVKPLDETQVKNVLGKIGVNASGLSAAFLKLLSVPNHLDIFCKIYNPALHLSQLSNLQDLFNELWKQKIINHPAQQGEECNKLLFQLAGKMYKQQVLSLSVNEIDAFQQTNLSYLTSNGLLLINDNLLQFFHQNFYDYVFAKSFVENNLSVTSYIKKEEQSIYIRPALKMILSFIRQKNRNEYTSLITSLLFSGGIRFHIQILVLNNIGYETNPSAEEIEIVTKKILPSLKFKLPFLESVVSKKWLSVIIEEKALGSLLSPEHSFIEKVSSNTKMQFVLKRIGLAKWFDPLKFKSSKEKYEYLWYWILRRGLPENRDIILPYLNSLPLTDENNYRVLRLMQSIPQWDNALSFKIFEKRTSQKEKCWNDILNLLEDAMDYDFNWSMKQIEKLLPITADRKLGASSSMYDHQMSECLKKMFSIDGEKSFVFGLERMRLQIKNMAERINTDTNELYHDGVYDLFEMDRDHTRNTDEMIFQLVLDTIPVLAKNDSTAFTDLVKSIQQENSLTILKIILIGLRSAPQKNSNTIFGLIMMLCKKNGLDDSLKFYVRDIITATYSLFTPVQKAELNEQLLNVRSDYEYWLREVNGKKIRTSYYGQLSFEYLSAIPVTEIMSFPILKKRFMELQRRFGEVRNTKRSGTFAYIAGPPLTENAYDKMSFDDWEKSFLKFDEDYSHTSHFEKGGLVENSRKFEEKVASNVAFFLPLINKIIDEQKVNADYVIAALSGMVKAYYSPDEMLLLVKKLMQWSLKTFQVRRLVWLFNYLVRNKLIDREIINYLCGIASCDPDPKTALNPNDPQHDILNSNRGAAVHTLVHCYYDPEFTNEIFNTLRVVVNDPVTSVRLAGLLDIALLMNTDKQRTLEHFLLFVAGTEDPHIFKAGVNSAQHLARYDFRSLIPYFEKAITIPGVQDDIATIIAIAWLNDKEGSYPMLQKVWKLSGKAKANTVNVGIKNYIQSEPEVRKKCEKFFSLFLNDHAKDLAHQYNIAFLHFDPAHFHQYLPLLKKYCKSRIAITDPHYYYEYLLKCAKNNPQEILDLVKYYHRYREPNMATGPYYSASDPVKVLIGAYNGLYDHFPLNKMYVSKAMYLFDKMMRKQLFRSESQRILDII